MPIAPKAAAEAAAPDRPTVIVKDKADRYEVSSFMTLKPHNRGRFIFGFYFKAVLITILISAPPSVSIFHSRYSLHFPIIIK